VLQRELFCVVHFATVSHNNTLPLNTFMYLTVMHSMCVLPCAVLNILHWKTIDYSNMYNMIVAPEGDVDESVFTIIV